MCLINPFPAGLIHPAEENTTLQFQDPLGKDPLFPSSLWKQEMLQWKLRATAAAFGYRCCERRVGFATQQEIKLKIVQVQVASSHAYLTSASKAPAANTSEMKYWGEI